MVVGYQWIWGSTIRFHQTRLSARLGMLEFIAATSDDRRENQIADLIGQRTNKYSLWSFLIQSTICLANPWQTYPTLWEYNPILYHEVFTPPPFLFEKYYVSKQFQNVQGACIKLVVPLYVGVFYSRGYTSTLGNWSLDTGFSHPWKLLVVPECSDMRSPIYK